MTVVALPQRDRDLFNATVQENGIIQKPPMSLDVISPVPISYIMMFYENGTEMEQHFVGRITEIELPILAQGAILCTAQSSLVSQMSFVRVDSHDDRYGTLLGAPHGPV